MHKNNSLFEKWMVILETMKLFDRESLIDFLEFVFRAAPFSA